MGSFAFANEISNNNNYENDETVKIENTVQIEISNLNISEDEVPCRWRTCTYRVNSDGSRTLIACTEWTYGECDKDSGGSLTPIKTGISDNKA